MHFTCDCYTVHQVFQDGHRSTGCFGYALQSWSVRVLAEIVCFVDPVTQALMIGFVSSQVTGAPEPLWKGLLYCFFLLAGSTAVPLAWGLQGWLERKVFLQMESSLIIAIYKKVCLFHCNERPCVAP